MQQIKALKTSFYKIVAALRRRAEMDDTFRQHHSFIPDYEDLVTRVRLLDEATESWWPAMWRGKCLLWCWTLSVLDVWVEAAVRHGLGGSVQDGVDKPLEFHVWIVLRTGAHKVVLPLQSVGVLGGRGRPAVRRFAAGPQSRPQDVLLCSRPLPRRKSAIDSWRSVRRRSGLLLEEVKSHGQHSSWKCFRFSRQDNKRYDKVKVINFVATPKCEKSVLHLWPLPEEKMSSSHRRMLNPASWRSGKSVWFGINSKFLNDESGHLTTRPLGQLETNKDTCLFFFTSNAK